MYGKEIDDADLETVGNYTVTLNNVGNPDYLQDPDRPLPGTSNGIAHVKNLKEASQVCKA